ncbi:MAG: hypothetical protein RR911_07210 [Oscillospiraceae bacterium]
MAVYRGTEAYDYNRISKNMNGRASSNAPKIQQISIPVATPQNKPRLVKKTKSQLKAETRRANRKAFKALSVAALLLGFIGMVIFSRVQLDEISRDITKTQSQLNVLQSENTRLEMQLNAMVSLNKVDDYAQNVLGMVKQEGYQIEYVDLEGSDQVLVSGGKTVTDNQKKLDMKKFWNISF